MASVVRISLGFFDPEQADAVELALAKSREKLEPGIRAMRGNLGYFAGIDRRANSISNVSLWETKEDAEQMAGFAAMQALAGEFVALGVRFQRPISNYETLWALTPAP